MPHSRAHSFSSIGGRAGAYHLRAGEGGDLRRLVRRLSEAPQLIGSSPEAAAAHLRLSCQSLQTRSIVSRE